MRIIFTGGGTGGHIYPALALIKELRKTNPEAEILYIGKYNSQEEALCSEENIAFKGIKIRGFQRRLSLSNMLTIYEFLTSVRKVKRIIKKFRPDWIVGTGGYVSAPVIYAGAKKRVKTLIHEQNSEPGMTNKFLAKYARYIAVSFPESAKHFPENKVILTGNPRAQVIVRNKPRAKSSLGLTDNKKLILIFMGSLGAKYVNETVAQALPLLANRTDLEIVFATGKEHFESIIGTMAQKRFKNVYIKPYIDNMADYYHYADLVICRAGATTLAEISALGLPAVLIPSPYVTNNHQEKNAESLVKSGGAVMIKEKELTVTALITMITSIIDDPYKLRVMRNKIKQFGITDSSDQILKLLE